MNKAPHFAVGLIAILALASGAFMAAEDSRAFDSREAMFFEPPAAEQSAPRDAIHRGGAKAAALIDYAAGASKSEINAARL